MNTPRETQVQLPAGQHRALTRAMVEAAATRLEDVTLSNRADLSEEPGFDRVTVVVNGHNVDPLSLVARALGLETDGLGPRMALQALQRLDYMVDDGTPGPTDDLGDGPNGDAGPTTLDSGDLAATGRQQTDRSPAHEPDSGYDEGARDEIGEDSGSGERNAMSPQVAQSLQRHRGEWVAVRDNHLVGHAATFAELDELLGPQKASIMFVPKRVPR